MSYVNMWVHLVWSTKYREPLLTEDLQDQLLKFIKRHAYSRGIIIDEINGGNNSVNCLLFLKPDQSVAQVAKMIKGDSAYWFNQQKFIEEYFGWQQEFFASSVGESELNQIRKQIQFLKQTKA